MAVGVAVGFRDGLDVGTLEGAAEIKAVGTQVGTDERTAEGRGVGTEDKNFWLEWMLLEQLLVRHPFKLK